MELMQHPEVLIFLASSLIVTIIWSVRLEGRVNYEAKIMEQAFNALKTTTELAHQRISENKAKHDEMSDRLFTEVGSIRVALAEISGYLRKEKEGK